MAALSKNANTSSSAFFMSPEDEEASSFRLFKADPELSTCPSLAGGLLLLSASLVSDTSGAELEATLFLLLSNIP